MSITAQLVQERGSGPPPRLGPRGRPKKKTWGTVAPDCCKTMARLTVAPPPPHCNLRGPNAAKQLVALAGEVEPPLAALLGALRLNH